MLNDSSWTAVELVSYTRMWSEVYRNCSQHPASGEYSRRKYTVFWKLGLAWAVVCGCVERRCDLRHTIRPASEKTIGADSEGAKRNRYPKPRRTEQVGYLVQITWHSVMYASLGVHLPESQKE